MSSNKNKQTFFKNEWLSNPKYQQWLQSVEDNKLAFCKQCTKTIRLSNMGETAIKSHKGPKHLTNCKPVSCFFKPKATVLEPTSSSSKSTESKAPENQTVLFFSRQDELEAEARWVLKKCFVRAVK